MSQIYRDPALDTDSLWSFETKKKAKPKNPYLKVNARKFCLSKKITSLILFFPQKKQRFLGGRSPSEPESQGRWSHCWGSSPARGTG